MWAIEQGPKCGDCRTINAARTPPQEPPCHTCKTWPLPGNADALNIFFIVRYQFIIGSGGPIAINHLAIDAAMDREGIANRKACFDKVATLAGWWIKRLNEKD